MSLEIPFEVIGDCLPRYQARCERGPLFDVTAARHGTCASRIDQNPLVVARDADPVSMIRGDPGRALIMGVLIHPETSTFRAGRWAF